MKKQPIIMFSRIVFVGIALTMILFLLMPKKAFSEAENRPLASFPEFSWDHLVDGSFIKGFETYLTDHFPFRDLFVGTKTEVMRSLGKTLENGVFFGDDHFLIGEYQKASSIDQITKNLNQFQEENPEVNMSFLLAPTSFWIYQELLPNFVDGSLQKKDFEDYQKKLNFPVISPVSRMEQEKDKNLLYYRTDHHWTTYGAYLAYVETCQSLGLTPYELSQFQREVVTKDFYGSLASKVNSFTTQADQMERFILPNSKFIIDYGTRKSDSFYEKKYLSEKDKYSYFLDNNHPLLTITNETGESKEEILVIKDSYANSFLPFLSLHYKKVHVIDPRYYKASISDYLKEKDISQVLFLYNLGNIDTDLGIQTVR